MAQIIYQLTKAPLPKEEWLTAKYLINTSFIGEVAEFVSDTPITVRRTFINHLLLGREKVFSRDGDKIQILPGGKKEYFERRYKLFKEKVANLSLEDFCDGYETFVLRETLSSKFSFYVYTANRALKPLDEFMRDVVEGSEYYIGGIVDYDC